MSELFQAVPWSWQLAS